MRALAIVGLLIPVLVGAQDLDADLHQASVTSVDPVTWITSSADSAEEARIERRNQEALDLAKDPGYFKFIVDKDRSRMAVLDRTELIGVFSVRLGTNRSEDGYGRFVNGESPRNTPIGVFRTGAGRPSADGFTWFIPYEVPGRSAMGIHGPKDTFPGFFYSFVHWTKGCIATTSKADILVIREAYRRARARGTPARVLIARGVDLETVPGFD